jgi:hypothetical protein
VRLRELPDWTNLTGPALELGLIKNVKPSPLGHFLILEIDTSGTRDFKMLEVDSSIMDRVLGVLKAHLGAPLKEIAELEI